MRFGHPKVRPPRRKATNLQLDPTYLSNRAGGLAKAGYSKPKWIEFCETLIANGFTCFLYEARQSVSKYVTVRKKGFKEFKVRFSNHAPIASREIAGDCDFFVGVTNLRTTNTSMALEAVEKHFSDSKNKKVKIPLDVAGHTIPSGLTKSQG